MKRLVAGGFALVLSGCTSLATHPEYMRLSDIPAAPTEVAADSRIAIELRRVTQLGNMYRNLGSELGFEDRASGAFAITSGIYGAATTAFRPVATNLKAALLAAGAAQAWRSSLKPAERAKVYIQGYRALSCVHTAGSALLEDYGAGAIQEVRQQIDEYWVETLAIHKEALQQEAISPNVARKALILRLEAQMDKLVQMDTALRVEEAALVDAPYRIDRVRSQIEDTIDKRLAAVAPDYAAALKLLTEKPKSSAGGGGTGSTDTKGAGTGGRPTLQEMVSELERTLPMLAARSPTRAADAYERMGECATKLG